MLLGVEACYLESLDQVLQKGEFQLIQSWCSFSSSAVFCESQFFNTTSLSLFLSKQQQKIECDQNKDFLPNAPLAFYEQDWLSDSDATTARIWGLGHLLQKQRTYTLQKMWDIKNCLFGGGGGGLDKR